MDELLAYRDSLTKITPAEGVQLVIQGMQQKTLEYMQQNKTTIIAKILAEVANYYQLLSSGNVAFPDWMYGYALEEFRKTAIRLGTSAYFNNNTGYFTDDNQFKILLNFPEAIEKEIDDLISTYIKIGQWDEAISLNDSDFCDNLNKIFDVVGISCKLLRVNKIVDIDYDGSFNYIEICISNELIYNCSDKSANVVLTDNDDYKSPLRTRLLQMKSNFETTLRVIEDEKFTINCIFRDKLKLYVELLKSDTISLESNLLNYLKLYKTDVLKSCRELIKHNWLSPKNKRPYKYVLVRIDKFDDNLISMLETPQFNFELNQLFGTTGFVYTYKHVPDPYDSYSYETEEVEEAEAEVAVIEGAKGDEIATEGAVEDLKEYYEENHMIHYCDISGEYLCIEPKF